MELPILILFVWAIGLVTVVCPALLHASLCNWLGSTHHTDWDGMPLGA